jgi:ribonuclease inhibitor
MTKKTAKAKRAMRAAHGKRAVIPARCASIDAVYDILARDLALPAHFGRNLDALYDALTGDVAGPIEIVVEDATALRRALGEKGRALLALLRDAGRARKDIRIEI